MLETGMQPIFLSMGKDNVFVIMLNVVSMLSLPMTPPSPTMDVLCIQGYSLFLFLPSNL